MQYRVLMFAPLFASALLLTACGGGGGGASSPSSQLPPSTSVGGATGGPSPTPTPTPAPSSGGFVSPSGGVTIMPPTAAGAFGSAILGTSQDGTLVVQSADAPAEPSGNTPTLPEYSVSASEAAGVATSARTWAAAAGRSIVESAPLAYRPLHDPLSTGNRTVAALRGRRALRVSPYGRAPLSVRSAQTIALSTQRTFHINHGVITGVNGSCTAPAISAGSDCYVDISAHLLSVSNHAYVWVDDAVAPGTAYGFSQSDFDTVASTFDADFTRETAAFGAAFVPQNPTPSYQQCDASGAQLAQSAYTAPPDLSGNDPHISIVVTNALESSGEGGYFDFTNLLNDQELNCIPNNTPHQPSNAAPMFVIGADKYTLASGPVYDESYWRTVDMPRSLPHEFQHYLHALDKVVAVDFNHGSGSFDDAFVDEGSSMLAEDLVNPNNAQSQDTLVTAFEYLYNPANYSLTAFTGWDANPLDTSSTPTYGFYRYTGGNYGDAYLFMRYLYDRFGGDAMLHRLYADTVSNGTSTSADTHPVVSAAANGETFAQLYGDYGAALAARNVAATDPRYRFASTVTLVGTKSIVFPGPTNENVVFDGPRSPDDLTSTQPYLAKSRIKLTVGGSVNAKVLQGGIDFFNVAPASAGATVRGTVTAPPPGLTAALTQGAYDDTGSCLGPPSSCP